MIKILGIVEKIMSMARQRQHQDLSWIEKRKIKSDDQRRNVTNNHKRKPNFQEGLLQ
jgi:hypothetical protein